MSDKEKDLGTIQALLERFNTQRLPVILAFKKKVDSGELLNDDEHQRIFHLQEEFNPIKALIDRNPEYQDLVAKVLTLWTEIIQKDIENQKNSKL